ncbi:heat-inducible transcription repressor HrcA [Thioalkalivibrio sp. K90mix]|jgi:heat-inducible transcriptional repressor|uniref:heat-inducible transcriptional repressor HrcA n=1 Tax=unclassified Thioalkalivibrio TaxID=2621013 RepID=UPI000195A9EC|nr:MULTISPECIES: heat-inducible transcriptional repressor HrcA [unclassified Thioalkalivibrio]ADC70973.1 heat-inducible transcription repressor HrcA [Thioalkalivibrio sp. K90mix]
MENAAINLDARARTLLRTLIESYIRDGQPVGSRTLARTSGLKVSAATVRNVMADLEDLGLIQAPHTSAGRIPTASGYRLFVDSLLQVREPTVEEIRAIQSGFDPNATTQDLMGATSNLLSQVTRMAGMVRLPRHRNVALSQLEFLRLGERRVLAILVIDGKEVQNRVLELERDFDQDQLQRMANYLNAHLAGKSLHAVRDALLREMRDVRENLDAMMLAAIDLGEKAVAGEDPDDVVVAGQTHLLSYEELADIDRLRQLLEAFNEKREILGILDQCIRSDRVQIFIGRESGLDWFENCSVVTAPYSVDGEVVGVLGVIGPARMSYDRVIPIVDVTARLLGSALGDPVHDTK